MPHLDAVKTEMVGLFVYSVLVYIGSGYLSATILIYYAMKHEQSKTKIQSFWDKILLSHLKVFYTVFVKSNSRPTPTQFVAASRISTFMFFLLTTVFTIMSVLLMNYIVILDTVKERTSNPFFAFLILPFIGSTIIVTSVWNTLKIYSLSE